MPVCADCLSAPPPLEAEDFCVLCKTPFQNRFPLDSEGRCALCRNGLRGFDSALCYGAYEGVLRDLIHLFKYSRMKPLARPLGEHLLRAVPIDAAFDAVVPVPLHWRRQWQRGFNQSEELARHIARRRGVPVLDAARRRRATRPQAGLSNSLRRGNVTGAFEIKRRHPVAGLRILLVDDVMTTGATGSACALALKRAGARSVCLLTLARVDRRLASSPADSNSRRSHFHG